MLLFCAFKVVMNEVGKNGAVAGHFNWANCTVFYSVVHSAISSTILSKKLNNFRSRITSKGKIKAEQKMEYPLY
jgi:hypothetical protein